jgi:DNA-directed RNA polymerase subunit beta
MIPNVSEDTKDLDENGMIWIGAEVKPGDILIGKQFKRESDPTPGREIASCNLGDAADVRCH